MTSIILLRGYRIGDHRFCKYIGKEELHQKLVTDWQNGVRRDHPMVGEQNPQTMHPQNNTFLSNRQTPR